MISICALLWAAHFWKCDKPLWYFGIILTVFARLYNHIKCSTLNFFLLQFSVKFSVLLMKRITCTSVSFRQKVFSGVCSVWKKSLLCADRLFYLSRQCDRGDPPVQELVTFTFCWIFQSVVLVKLGQFP